MKKYTKELVMCTKNTYAFVSNNPCGERCVLLHMHKLYSIVKKAVLQNRDKHTGK